MLFRSPLSALWLPIIVSAVAVFVASSIIHMGPFWHRSDYPKMANQDQVMDVLRPLNIAPGGYFFPRPSSYSGMREPEFVARMKAGPVGMLTVFPPGEMGMGRQLGLWFGFCLVVGVFGAYIAGTTLAPGTPYLRVFQIVGAATFFCYAVALWEMWIWYRRDLSLTIKSTVDGLVYAVVTAGVFGWLWPAV